MLHIDYLDSRPIHQQVRDGLRRLMLSGGLQPGDQLPSVRKLATELARRAGLDGADFAAALARGDDTQREREAVAYAGEVLRPRGVPTIYLNGEEITLREYTKEEMIRLLQEGARRDAAPGFTCGEDGCTLC